MPPMEFSDGHNLTLQYAIIVIQMKICVYGMALHFAYQLLHTSVR